MAENCDNKTDEYMSPIVTKKYKSLIQKKNNNKTNEYIGPKYE